MGRFCRRSYKERVQPDSRKKYGFLEKHRDYVLRSKAYNRKKEALRRLKLKAEFRNPDEFNFKMINSKLREGVHQPKDPDEFRYNYKTKTQQGSVHQQLKTQENWHTTDKGQKSMKNTSDLKLIHREKKKVETLNAMLHSLGGNLNHVYLDGGYRKTESSYKELHHTKTRAWELETLYKEKSAQNEHRPIFKRYTARKR